MKRYSNSILIYFARVDFKSCLSLLAPIQTDALAPPPPPPPPQTQIHACKRYVCHLPTLVNMPSTHTMRDKERERANEYMTDKFNYTKVKPVFLVFCYDRRKRTEKGNQFAPALSLHSWWKHFRLSSSGCLIALVLALRPGSNG